jgi:ATP synthase F1 delta subunit
MEKSQNINEFMSNHLARAVFELARAEGTVDRVEDELGQLSGEIMHNLDLKKLVTDPAIQDVEKIRAILTILGPDSTDAIKSFASTAIIMKLFESVEQIYKDYIEITNKFKKQVSVEVISAIELENSILQGIKKEVDSKTGLDVRVRNTVDSKVIGGIIIKIGERIIDLSIKNKIEDLKTKLKALELRGEDFGFEN